MTTTTPTAEPVILVTGASGHLGRLAVRRLLARGAAPASLVATARDTAAIADLAALGVRTARLDYDDESSVDAAIAGVDRVLLVSGTAIGSRVRQHRTVVDAAVRAGVSRIAYTSALRADDTPLPVGDEHLATETLIAASGIPAVILRNGWYIENAAGELAAAAATGVLETSIGDGRVAGAAREDFADAAAVVLLDDARGGVGVTVHELNGDRGWTYAEIADALGEVLGRPVEYRRVTRERRTESLVAAGFDPATAEIFVAFEAGIDAGGFDRVGDDLTRIIGRPTTALVEGFRALAAG